MTDTEKTIEHHREDFEEWLLLGQTIFCPDSTDKILQVVAWQAWQAARGVKEMKNTDIGSIGNFYGGLSVKIEDSKFYWSIENYDGENWEEIPKYLYDSLMKFELERDSEI